MAPSRADSLGRSQMNLQGRRASVTATHEPSQAAAVMSNRPAPRTLRRSPAPTLRRAAVAILVGGVIHASSAALQTLDATRYHLRSGTEAEWQEFAGKVPHGRRLDIRFTARTNQAEATLFIRQSDVKLDWN